MSMVLTSEPLPLVADIDGVVRVAKTRVTLDTVVAAFQDGLTAEEIAQHYPALPLGQIYAVIGYYLVIRATPSVRRAVTSVKVGGPTPRACLARAP